MRARSFLAIFIVAITAATGAAAQSRLQQLNEAGWKALQEGDGSRAAGFFDAALDISPHDPVLLLGAGAAAEAQGRHDAAVEHLQASLEQKPNLTEASRLLGMIEYQEGHAEVAIQVYEQALKLAPTNREIVSQLDAWRKETDIHRQFEERRYDRFRVMFEGRAEESLAADATDVLNSAFWRIGNKLGAYPPNTIVTMLYTEKEFRDITRAPDWSDGLYDGKIRVPVAGASHEPQLFERVLTHELTHAMLAGMAPRGLPTWLHEGLAQYFAGDDPEAARRRMHALGRSIPLSQLEGGFGRLPAPLARVAYDESLIAVSVIFDRPTFGWTQLFHALQSQPCERALDTFGFSYADLEAGFGL